VITHYNLYYIELLKINYNYIVEFFTDLYNSLYEENIILKKMYYSYEIDLHKAIQLLNNYMIIFDNKNYFFHL